MTFEQLSGLAKRITEDKTVNPVNLSKVTNKRSASVRQTKGAPALLAHTQGFTELGRYLVTKQPKDIGAFKTPTLRDIELTTPYMHNGSEKTLIDVVRFYNRGGNENANLDERMRLLHLSDEEINELVEFLTALTSDDVLRQAQSAKPQTRTAVTVGPFRGLKQRAQWK
jgi:cytochrome c peroxidase